MYNIKFASDNLNAHHSFLTEIVKSCMISFEKISKAGCGMIDTINFTLG